MAFGRAVADRIAAAALVVLAAIIVWQSALWPDVGGVAGDVRVMPRALAGLMILVAAALAFGRRAAVIIPAEARPARTLAAVAATVALALLLELLGLIGAGIPYLIAMQRIAGASMRVALPVAVVTPIVIWLVFAVALKVPLPPGELWSMLGK